MYKYLAAACTHCSVQVHDPSSLGVNRAPILIPWYQIHAQHLVPMVYLGANQLLQLLELILQRR